MTGADGLLCSSMGFLSRRRVWRPRVIALVCLGILLALTPGSSALARTASAASAESGASAGSRKPHKPPSPLAHAPPFRRTFGQQTLAAPAAWPAIRSATSGWPTPATTVSRSMPRPGACWPPSARTWTPRPASPPTRPGMYGSRTPVITRWSSSPRSAGCWPSSVRRAAAAVSWTNPWRWPSPPSATSGSPIRATAGWRSSPRSAATECRSRCRRPPGSGWTSAAMSGCPARPTRRATRSGSSPGRASAAVVRHHAGGLR